MSTQPTYLTRWNTLYFSWEIRQIEKLFEIFRSFVSILTVGYGGIRVGESNAWPCVAYIFLGSAVLAACVCILKEDVVDEIAAFRTREMRRKGIRDSFS